MSLNTIRIPDILLGELYRDNLLATTAYPSPVAEETAVATGSATPPPAPAEPTVSVPRSKAAPASTGPAPLPGPLPSANTAKQEPAVFPEPTVGKSMTTPATTVIAPDATVNAPAAAASTPAPVAPAASTAPPVSLATPASAPASAAAPDYKTLGNNRRNITILVQNPGIAFLADDQLSFLTKILEACRLNIGDVAIVNCATAPVTITALRQQLRPSVLLLFGLDPLQIQLPISFPVFKIQEYDAAAYLCAPPLDQLVENTPESKLLKSRLWVCLKTLFNV